VPSSSLPLPAQCLPQLPPSTHHLPHTWAWTCQNCFSRIKPNGSSCHPSQSQNDFDCKTKDHHTGSGSLNCPPPKNQRLLTANLHTPHELSGNAPPAFFFSFNLFLLCRSSSAFIFSSVLFAQLLLTLHVCCICKDSSCNKEDHPSLTSTPLLISCKLSTASFPCNLL
jgi:hypothetical protein